MQDSLNGTLKRAGGKSRDSPYRKKKIIKFPGKMLLSPADNDVIIVLRRKKAPSDEDCAAAVTPGGHGLDDAAAALEEKGMPTGPFLG